MYTLAKFLPKFASRSSRSKQCFICNGCYFYLIDFDFLNFRTKRFDLNYQWYNTLAFPRRIRPSVRCNAMEPKFKKSHLLALVKLIVRRRFLPKNLTSDAKKWLNFLHGPFYFPNCINKVFIHVRAFASIPKVLVMFVPRVGNWEAEMDSRCNGFAFAATFFKDFAKLSNDPLQLNLE